MDTANQLKGHLDQHIQLDDMALQPSSPVHSVAAELNDHQQAFSNSEITPIAKAFVDHCTDSQECRNAEQIRQLLRDSTDSLARQYKDHCDDSNSPSFSEIKLPYPLICRERLRLMKKLYERQFQREIQHIINQQAKAFDAVCLVRVMAITSLWPPLHTRRNIDHTHQQYFQLTPKQKKRLEYIMRVDWSKT